jgi:cysteine desulfurase
MVDGGGTSLYAIHACVVCQQETNKKMASRPIYLDCAATTPIEPEVREVILEYLDVEFGNAGSRTHEYGSAALRAINRAREQVAAVVSCDPEEVVFTSGATESNNVAILGLANGPAGASKRRIVSTSIEHKAVLEPIEHLASRGFEVHLVAPSAMGRINADDVLRAVGEDTLLVSVMHVNNETGVIQPIEEIADGLRGKDVYFHVDGSQGFGKDIERLRHPRIDMISISGHKIFAPKGIGALVTRRRLRRKIPLSPLQFGGGQERGLRPGTQPVHLIAALGMAGETALRDSAMRRAKCLDFRQDLLAGLAPLDPTIICDSKITVPGIASLRFNDADAESVIIALRNLVSISSGSACTSAEVKPSHVLLAMGLTLEDAYRVTRWSWSHLTPSVKWADVRQGLQRLF